MELGLFISKGGLGALDKNEFGSLEVLVFGAVEKRGQILLGEEVPGRGLFGVGKILLWELAGIGFHVLGPQGNGSTGSGKAMGVIVIIAHPNQGQNMGGETDKPSIFGVTGGSGFSRSGVVKFSPAGYTSAGSGQYSLPEHTH